MISIFAKPAFLNINPSQPFALRKKPVRGGHLMRVSSIIRGEQIAKRIGAKLNPESGYENDVCIYVKPYMIGKDVNIELKGRVVYLDIVDGHNLGHVLLKYPHIKAIVCSQVDMKTMSKVVPNEIVCIPQQHCNFKRIKRNRKRVITVGAIGTRNAFPLIPQKIKLEIEKRNMKLVEFSRFFARQDIIDFYMNIDVQLVWRPYKKLLSNPLKLVNASSFGVPTIALDEPAFKEVEGCYIGVKTPEEWLEKLDELIASPKLYEEMAKTCLKKSEKYHISNIAKLYESLT